jgi:hypothetical protein
MSLGHLAEEHPDELIPALEPLGVSVGFGLPNGTLKLVAGEHIQNRVHD